MSDEYATANPWRRVWIRLDEHETTLLSGQDARLPRDALVQEIVAYAVWSKYLKREEVTT